LTTEARRLLDFVEQALAGHADGLARVAAMAPHLPVGPAGRRIVQEKAGWARQQVEGLLFHLGRARADAEADARDEERGAA
jgi:hypothetical protein